jgi:hypothetical protein
MQNGRKTLQMTVKHTIIFHSKALQNLPNWDFWFENIYHLANLGRAPFLVYRPNRKMALKKLPTERGPL